MLALHTANKADTDPARTAPLCDDFVVLSLYPEQMPAIRQHNPNARFHVRWWTPKGDLPNVYDTERDIRTWWDTWGQYVSTFRAANECNLENPGYDWLTWQMDLAIDLRHRIPEIVYFLPAPSPGLPDFAAYVSEAAWLAEEIVGITGLDAHAYGSPEEVAVTLATFREYWTGPLNVTEWNYGAGREWDLNRYAQDLPKYLDVGHLHKVQFMACFIFEWDRPDMVLPTTVDIKDTPMEVAMRDYEEDDMTTATIGNLEVIDMRGELPDEQGKMLPVPFTEKDFISVHHTVTPTTTSAKSIYDYHKSQGWGGIGYNFLVRLDGTIEYVGECNTARAAVGQIKTGNRRGVHIAMVIDLTQEDPTPAMLAAVKKLIANIQHAYGWFMPVTPHCLFNSDSQWDTSCPWGWRAWWKQVIRAVGE